MIGRDLEHYRIIARLGAAGAGEVWRATDRNLDRDVALRILPAETARDPGRLERFRREAAALAVLDHPGIVTVFSLERADEDRFLTMQLVEGRTLGRLIASGMIGPGKALDLGKALAEALAAAHEKGITHRNLKPSNIMIADHGALKVLDFGLAGLFQPEEKRESGKSPPEPLAGQGQVRRSAPYLSPEQIEGGPTDPRTDVFAVGVILYEMATRRRPFDGDSDSKILSAILRDEPPSVRDVDPGLPAGLDRVIRGCLEKDPGRRHPSGREVCEELEAAERD